MRRILLISCTLSALVGCAGSLDPNEFPPSNPSGPTTTAPSPETFGTARILVDDDPYFPKTEVIRGCEYWLDAGEQCLLVSDPAQADIHIVPSYDVCPPHEGGGVVLAWATGGGLITVYVRCLAKTDSTVNVAYLHVVLAHEIGHQMGVWDHVPANCDGTEKVAPDNVHICGKAVMNPYINGDLTALTVLDIEAHKVIDPKQSVTNGTVTTTRSALTASFDCKFILYQ